MTSPGLLRRGTARLVALLLVVSLYATAMPVARAADPIVVEDGDVAGLFDAIVTANSTGQEVHLAANGTYTLTQAYDQQQGNGLPQITGTVTIRGNGATIERVQGEDENSFRFFYIMGSLLLDSVHLREGDAIGSAGSLGGAIFNWGTTTLINSIVSGGEAYRGGAVYQYGGTLTVISSTLLGNHAVDSGGAIYFASNPFDSAVTLINSTLSGNVASSGGAIGATIDPKGFTGTAQGDSGGNGATLLQEFEDSLTLINSTVHGNRALYGGGGIWTEPNLFLTLRNSIIAGNEGQFAPDLNAEVDVGGFNLLGIDDGSSGLQHGSDGNLVGTIASPIDPLLGPLQDNGGSTPTIALLDDSPALDAGEDAVCNAPPVDGVDQRGVARPQDGDGDGLARCDIGAFEREADVVAVPIDVKPGSAANSINLKSRGVTPVAVLSSDNFDATTIAPETVCFGAAGAVSERDCSEAHGRAHREDVNRDGRADLVFHFNTQETGIQAGDSRACLGGETSDGQRIEGCDSIQAR